MDSVNLDPAVMAQLEKFTLGVTVCDNSGQAKGVYIPFEDPKVYQDFKFSVSTDELRRRAKESTGRSLDEIMNDLEKLP